MKYDIRELVDLTPPLGQCMNDYSLTEDDMRVVLALFSKHNVKTVLEFGVNEGATAKQVLLNRQEVTHYVGVDLVPELFPDRGIVPKVAGSMAVGDPRLHTVLVDGTNDGFHREMSKMNSELRFNTYDAIIMDADHEELATQRDTELCSMYLKSGGLWLWHDYNVESRQHSNGRPFGLKKYLDRLEASGRQLMFPDQVNRDPWKCVSVAWEVSK